MLTSADHIHAEGERVEGLGALREVLCHEVISYMRQLFTCHNPSGCAACASEWKLCPKR